MFDTLDALDPLETFDTLDNELSDEPLDTSPPDAGGKRMIGGTEYKTAGDSSHVGELYAVKLYAFAQISPS